MAPAQTEAEAMERLRGLLAQTPQRCLAREILETSLPILDRSADRDYETRQIGEGELRE